MWPGEVKISAFNISSFLASYVLTGSEIAPVERITAASKRRTGEEQGLGPV